MQSASPCSLCKQGGHNASKCPDLRAPLQEGFYSGGGGGGGHSHDDDEGCANALKKLSSPQPLLPTQQDHYDDPNNDEDERLRNLLFRGDGGHGPDCYELRA